MENERKIISASRRTDIPAFHSEWFFEKLKQGFVNVRNPFNPKQVRKISLRKEDVLCFVFWTKDPSEMIKYIHLLKDHSFYFLFTVNSYASDVEPNVPEKDKRIKVFRNLSEVVGNNRIIWRYDPVLLSKKYNEEYHFVKFEYLAGKLHGYTNKCIFSFIDMYRKTIRKTAKLELLPISENCKIRFAEKFSQISKKYDLEIQTCAEKIDLRKYFIENGSCIDGNLISEITGEMIKVGKDKNQRKECLCSSSIDIGSYNTCSHNCLYCYANK